MRFIVFLLTLLSCLSVSYVIVNAMLQAGHVVMASVWALFETFMLIFLASLVYAEKKSETPATDKVAHFPGDKNSLNN